MFKIEKESDKQSGKESNKQSAKDSDKQSAKDSDNESENESGRQKKNAVVILVNTGRFVTRIKPTAKKKKKSAEPESGDKTKSCSRIHSFERRF